MGTPTPQFPFIPPRPSTSDRGAWRAYWHAQGQPWRTEPEIPVERQIFLSARRDLVPDIQAGVYPFGGVELVRADVEWLLATHQRGQGPVEWRIKSQRSRIGLDLRGALLIEADLAALPLARLWGGLAAEQFEVATPYERDRAAVHMSRAYMTSAHLEAAELAGAYLDEAVLIRANLTRANLRYAHLESAALARARLTDADLTNASLIRARLNHTHLEGALMRGAVLSDARFDHAHLEGANMETSYWDRVDLSTAHLSGTIGVPELLRERGPQPGLGILVDEIGGANETLALRLSVSVLSARNLAMAISVLTELHTKCRLVYSRRYNELAEYSEVRDARLDDEANLVVARLSYNSPLDIVFLMLLPIASAIGYAIRARAHVGMQREQSRIAHEHVEWALETATQMVERLDPNADSDVKLRTIHTLFSSVERLGRVEGALRELPPHENVPALPSPKDSTDGGSASNIERQAH